MQKAARLVSKVTDVLTGIDWTRKLRDLVDDDFDDGRTPAARRKSFERWQLVAIAREGERFVRWLDCSLTEPVLRIWSMCGPQAVTDARGLGPRCSR